MNQKPKKSFFNSPVTFIICLLIACVVIGALIGTVLSRIRHAANSAGSVNTTEEETRIEDSENESGSGSETSADAASDTSADSSGEASGSPDASESAGNEATDPGNPAPAASEPLTSDIFVSYSAHVQIVGWQDAVSDGAVAGTEDQGLRLEAITVAVPDDPGLDVRYRSHIEIDDWEPDWRWNGDISGTTGQEKRLEALQIMLEGPDASRYDIYYCVKTGNYGWLAWASNGQEAGTQGYHESLEALRIVIREKGKEPPANLSSNNQAFLYNPNPT